MPVQSKPAAIGPWGKATAGAAGAAIANALVYPLDIVKTRLQVQVKRKDGANGKADKTDKTDSVDGTDSTDSTDLVLAGDEKTNGSADTTPHYTSTWDAITKIAKQDGALGLYAGINGALIGVASTNFAYFYWYSVVRSVYERSAATGVPPSTAVELSLGAISGAIAQLFTIPVAVVTTRQQTQSKDERKGLLATAREVVDSEDGVSGLWRGLKASLVLVVNPAITYGAYERLKQIFFPGRTSLRPWEAFVLGAMSKALATLATQPLIVAKVGLQSKPPPARNGKPFKSFVEVMEFIVAHEGPLGLFKGIGPQLLKGLLVQGFLMMTKERVELLFVLFFRYIRKLRSDQLAKRVAAAAPSPVVIITTK